MTIINRGNNLLTFFTDRYDLKMVDIESDPVSATFPPTRAQLEESKQEGVRIKRFEPNLDIDKNSPWFKIAYKYQIPVVHLNGSEISRHSLSEKKLLDALNNHTTTMNRE